MHSSERPLGFGTAVRAVVSSTPFFTLACLTAAIALLMSQPVSQLEEVEVASLSMSVSNNNVDGVNQEEASASATNTAESGTP